VNEFKRNLILRIFTEVCPYILVETLTVEPLCEYPRKFLCLSRPQLAKCLS
jgi:hypothetical protein